MYKLLICMVMVLTIVVGSISYGADMPKLDNKTTLSIINFIMEFYYAMHHGEADKVQAMFIPKRSVNVIHSWIRDMRRQKIYDYEKMEITGVSVSPDEPDEVDVFVKFKKSELYPLFPIYEELIILKLIGNQWKIRILTEAGVTF